METSDMKQRMLSASLLGTLALAAMPVAAQTFTANARVLSAVPVREAVTAAPRQECWTEYSQGGGNRAVGAVIGGIAGGLIGHQIGSGSGNTAATIAGTLGGAAVGNEVAKRGSDPRAVERCRTVSDYEDRVVGYDVVYRYQGREFSTRMPYDPGPDLRVNVTVVPEG
jgi:uncharacterized protein YcfJ